MTRVYIAGPIAGRVNGNAAAFERAARMFAENGHEAVNPHAVEPHEHEGPSAGQAADGSEPRHKAPCYMRSDMQALLMCDVIYLLRGWERSTGATAELLAAKAAGLQIWFEPTGPTHIRLLQEDMADWQQRHFGDGDELSASVGLAEEVGEVCRAVVKRHQGIRGTREEWDAEIRKEVGDVFIKLVDVARTYGFDLADAIAERWGTIQRRNWKADPQGHGIDPGRGAR